MRLNGWQRIGIVASVIWAIGAPSADAQSAEDDYKKSKEECVEQGLFPSNRGLSAGEGQSIW
jgi:hypothetical protein